MNIEDFNKAKDLRAQIETLTTSAKEIEDARRRGEKFESVEVCTENGNINLYDPADVIVTSVLDGIYKEVELLEIQFGKLGKK